MLNVSVGSECSTCSPITALTSGRQRVFAALRRSSPAPLAPGRLRRLDGWRVLRHQRDDPVNEHAQLAADMAAGREGHVQRHRI
jgi:hypothetical protein